MDRGAARRSHDSDPARKRWNGLLARGIEQPFRRQLRLELLEGNLQCTRAFWFEELGGELQFPARLVDGEASAGDDRHSVSKLEAQQARLRAEHHHPHLRAFVLEREVKVSRLGGTEVGDFALDPHVGVFALHARAHRRHQVAHGPDAALRLRLEAEPKLVGEGHYGEFNKAKEVSS